MLRRRSNAALVAVVVTFAAIVVQTGLGASSGGDHSAPRRIRLIQVTSADASSVSFAWTPSNDNVEVEGYGVYLDGVRTDTVRTDTTTNLVYRFDGLACGKGFVIGVDAFDAAGNRSDQTSATVSTAACADSQPPSAPTGIRLAAASDTSVVLAWNPSSDNVGVTGYGLYVAGLRVGSSGDASATVSGLACGKSYVVSVDAVDAAGNRSSRTNAYFSTSRCVDTQAPTAPTNLAPSNATKTSVSLGWTASRDNVAVTGYELYRNGTRTGTATSTVADFSGLACGTAYTLGVAAVDAAGNRSGIAAVSAPTSPCSTTAPAYTSSIGNGASVAAGTTWTVGVTPAPDRVEFWADGTKLGEDSTAPYAIPLNLAAGTHDLGLCAVISAQRTCFGTAGVVATITVTSPPPPSAPSAPAYTSSIGNGASVAAGTTWTVGVTPAPDRVEFWADGTKLGEDSTAPYAIPLNLAAGTHDLGLCAVISAQRTCFGTAGVVATITVTSSTTTSSSGDASPPTMPSGLRTVSSTATSVSVSWLPSTDNVAVAGYGLYRGTGSVGSTGQTTASFTGLACGTAYQVGVDAYDSAGNRSARASLTVTTAACGDSQPPTTPSNAVVSSRTATSIALTWLPSTDNVGVVAYGLYKAGVQVGTTSGTSGIVSGLTCGTSYTLGVDAEDAAGNYLATSRGNGFDHRVRRHPGADGTDRSGRLVDHPDGRNPQVDGID